MILPRTSSRSAPSTRGSSCSRSTRPPPRTPLETSCRSRTEVLELEITSIRPDCLGVYGIAREAHAATGAALKPPPWAEDPGAPGPVEGVSITVESPDLCPRFTARVFEDVKIGPSPPWLKARLMAAGQRPISNVVDITNYGCCSPASRCTRSTSTGSRATADRPPRRRRRAGARPSTGRRARSSVSDALVGKVRRGEIYKTPMAGARARPATGPAGASRSTPACAAARSAGRSGRMCSGRPTRSWSPSRRATRGGAAGSDGRSAEEDPA